MTFAGTHATDPMLARLATDLGISANILGGTIEEIGTRPFGNLLISVPRTGAIRPAPSLSNTV